MLTCAIENETRDVMVSEQEAGTKFRVRKDFLVQEEEIACRNDGEANPAHTGRNQLT